MVTFSVHAQVKPNLGTVNRMMNDAKTQMDKGNYESANVIFRQIIEGNYTIPQEMPYYFAETLYHLEQYDNSANFLKKYLEINRSGGDHFEAAKALENKLAEPLLAIRSCQLCDRKGYRYEPCSKCHGEKITEKSCQFCKSRGEVGCTTCMGSGLVTRRNVFNIIEYHECAKCSNTGRTICPVCEGTKQELITCMVCKGNGTQVSDQLCDHIGEINHTHEKIGN
ncbi:outer membrane protein assembly factor BamD [Pararhodonellum marinum]|uniref:tetratricopeptide repeat protein n=1 Tax=Pararhodonellum marinum TaxID=2755358 RepID=UPI001890B44D|nr:tetratricopeptide repeat protein [Pararhodonellum marinum]